MLNKIKNWLLALRGRDYARLYRTFQALRENADEMEESMTDDLDRLESENDYLKSELAGLRIQYDRLKTQREAQGDKVYPALEAEIIRLHEQLDKYMERDEAAQGEDSPDD